MENIFFDLKRLKYLGVGAIIGKTVRVRHPEDVIIGDYSIIDDFTYISSKLELGSYCHIASNVNISGGGGKVVIGNFVGIASGVSLHTASSSYLTSSFELPSIPKEYQFGGDKGDITIADHVLLGAKSTILPGVELPEGFASAAGATIGQRVYDSWALYGGPRVKKITNRPSEEVLQKAAELLSAQNDG